MIVFLVVGTGAARDQLTAPQFALMAVSVANHKVRSTKLIPQVQAAIGRQLGTELEVPRSLTPELAAFVIQLARV